MLRNPKPVKIKEDNSILTDPKHLELFKLADHKLDGSESPVKLSNRE